MNQKGVIIDEFTSMKKDNLIIILAFVSSVFLFSLLFILPLNDHGVVRLLILAMVLFMVGLLLFFFKILRLLRVLGFKIQ